MHKRTIIYLIGLIIIWIIFTIAYIINSDYSVRTLSYDYKILNINPSIYKNHSYTFIFKSESDNLGTIIIPFTTGSKTLNDAILFRIKIEGSEKWYYQNKYVFQNANGTISYPIGFPIIENSKNKIYRIEILSNSINKKTPLYVDGKKNIVIKYSFSPNYLIKNPSKIFFFINEKEKYAFDNYNLLNALIFFSLPIFGYIFYLLFQNRINKASIINIVLLELAQFHKPLVKIVIILVVIYIFILNQNLDLIISAISFFWIIVLIKYRLGNKSSFILALIFLSISPILLQFKMDRIAERSAVWAFMFLIIGTIHILVEENPGIFSKIGNNIIFKGMRDISLLLFNVLMSLIIFLISYPYLFFIRSKPTSKREWILLSFKSTIVTFVLFITLVMLLIGNYYLNKMMAREKINPRIVSVEPHLAYRPTKVIMYGKEFGWQPEGSKLMSQYGEVKTIYWSDTKIIFNIPFEWKDGYINLYIQKPKEFYGKKLLVRSKISSIKLLPSHAMFTPDDDAFFKELPTLQKEVREINGYE